MKKDKIQTVVITPNNSWNIFNLKEILDYRELIYIFSWRDLKVKYKQTLLGIIWVVFQPLISMIIFTVLFGNLAKVQSGNLPYSLFVLIGLVFWNFFSGSLTSINDSLLANENIIKKVYFPKIILPLASLLTNSVDFIINTIIVIIFAIILGYPPGLNFIIIYPFLFILAAFSILGIGLFMSSLNVKYRDVRYILPFFVQILFFFTPIIYPTSIVATAKKYILALNPMTTVIEGARFIFDPASKVNIQFAAISLLSLIIIFAVGLWHFNKTERFIADIV